MSFTEGCLRRRKRMAFTPDEDDRLRELVAKHGENDWGRIAAKLQRRDRRQCRERWFNYLSPRVENGPWTADEEVLLRRKVVEFGRKWKTIQSSFPGRTDINIKNHWKLMTKLASGRAQRPQPTQEKDIFKNLADSLVFDQSNAYAIDSWADFGVF
jgi:hypothetical protein